MNVVRSLMMIAEQRISEAMRKGDLTSEKWKNKPLPLDDDSHIPDDLKMAYKLLKNSGYLPPEIEERKKIEKLEDLIVSTVDEHERLRQMKKLNVLLMKLDSSRPASTSISSQNDYYRQVVERISLRSQAQAKDKEDGNR